MSKSVCQNSPLFVYTTLLLYIDTLCETFTLSPNLYDFLCSLPTLNDAYDAPMCVHEYITSKTAINDICLMSLRLCDNNNDSENVNDMIDAFQSCLVRFDVYTNTLHDNPNSDFTLLSLLNANNETTK